MLHSGGMQVLLGKQPARRVSEIDFAPLLVKEVPNAALLSSDLLQVVQALEQQIAQIGNVGFALDPQMGHACAREDIEGHMKELLPLLRA
jgi:hypothetical protein